MDKDPAKAQWVTSDQKTVRSNTRLINKIPRNPGTLVIQVEGLSALIRHRLPESSTSGAGASHIGPSRHITPHVQLAKLDAVLGDT